MLYTTEEALHASLQFVRYWSKSGETYMLNMNNGTANGSFLAVMFEDRSNT